MRHWRRTTLVLAGTAALLACTRAPGDRGASPTRLTLGGKPPAITSETDLRAFLDELESQEFAIGTAANLESYYQWRGETTNRSAQTQRLLNDLLNRPDYAAVVDAWWHKVADSTLERRLELHHRQFLQSKANPTQVIAYSDLQNAIQDTIEQFRYTLTGQRMTGTAIGEAIDTSSNRETRRAAFISLPQRSVVIGPAVLHAMSLFDSLGRQEGFRSGVEAGLNSTSLNRDQVLHDIDAFELATRPTYLALLERAKRDLKIDRVEPWDIDYWLHLQERGVADAYPLAAGVSRLRDLFRALGFKVDSLPIDVRVFDVPTGGITFPIRSPFEARLLTNPFTGSNFYETLFHEYGHAVNAVTERPNLSPIFLGGDETPMGEGTAETLGWFAYDRHWIARAAHVSPAKAKQLERIGKDNLLLWLRRSICMSAWVEINAYSDLNADLNTQYHDAYRRFVGVELPPGDYFGNGDMLATGPLYFQSYLYANMIAGQFHEAMEREFHSDDLSNDPRVANWMITQVFAEGALVPWPTKVIRATGKPLSIDALVKYLTQD